MYIQDIFTTTINKKTKALKQKFKKLKNYFNEIFKDMIKNINQYINEILNKSNYYILKEHFVSKAFIKYLDTIVTKKKNTTSDKV